MRCTDMRPCQLTISTLQVTTAPVNVPGADVKTKMEDTDLSVYADELAHVDPDDDGDN